MKVLKCHNVNANRNVIMKKNVIKDIVTKEFTTITQCDNAARLVSNKTFPELGSFNIMCL